MSQVAVCAGKLGVATPHSWMTTIALTWFHVRHDLLAGNLQLASVSIRRRAAAPLARRRSAAASSIIALTFDFSISPLMQQARTGPR